MRWVYRKWKESGQKCLGIKYSFWNLTFLTFLLQWNVHNTNFTILTILSIQLSGIKYIYNFVQSSTLPISRTFCLPKKCYPLNNSPFSPPPSLWQPALLSMLTLFYMFSLALEVDLYGLHKYSPQFQLGSVSVEHQQQIRGREKDESRVLIILTIPFEVTSSWLCPQDRTQPSSSKVLVT